MKGLPVTIWYSERKSFAERFFTMCYEAADSGVKAALWR